MLAPISRSVAIRPVRSGLVITASSDQLGARHDQRGDQRERRRGRIGRHHHVRRLELRLTGKRDAAAVLAIRLGRHLGAEMLEHAFGVVARRFRFDHGGLARRGQPRQQHRRFQLRRRHRRLRKRSGSDRARLQASAAGGRRRPPRRCARPSSPAARARAASAACATRRRRRRSPSPASRRLRRSPAGSRCRNCRNRGCRAGCAKPPTPTP